jgi:alpha-galactosidase
LPASTVIPVQLQAGSNTIQFGNNTGYAPALDRIAIAPVVESATLTGMIASKTGSEGVRIWKVSLSNSGLGRALGAQINTISVTQTTGDGSCHPKALIPLPIELKSIAPGGNGEVDVPIDFSRCTASAQFSVSLIFSADNGAEVGNVVGSGETR